LCPYGVIYFAIMPTTDIGLDKTLAALGMTDATQVAARFEKVFAYFDA